MPICLRPIATRLILLTSLIVAGPASSQTGSPAGQHAGQSEAIQKEGGIYTIHGGTQLVLLDVTVTDKHGHPVDNLTQDDFRLIEDGQPQTITFFEPHVAVGAAELSRQKAAALAALQPNTFTNYEPLTARPLTVLLVNELFPLPDDDLEPLHNVMLTAIAEAPPDTPFVVYMLDADLHLVQSVTTDRALLKQRIDLLWKTPHFGAEFQINPTGLPPQKEIAVRRRIASEAMRQLVESLKDEPGRKNLFAFTGGFQCSVVAASDPTCPNLTFPNDAHEYLCSLMDTLEQGRMSIYREDPDGKVVYGFGCSSGKSDLKDLFGAYFTLYYTPANSTWDGKYRTTKLVLADKTMHAAYRQGYYGTPENSATHYHTATHSGTTGTSHGTDGSPTADTVAAKISSVDFGTPANPATDATPVAASSVFTVQIIPAMSPTVPDSSNGSDEQEFRQLTLRLSMPASEFKVVPSATGEYAAHIMVGAIGYSNGRPATTNGSQSLLLAANFNGPADQRITDAAITATLKVSIPERGKNRWLYITVRDITTGQMGSQIIPMAQIKMPGQ